MEEKGSQSIIHDWRTHFCISILITNKGLTEAGF